LVFRNDSLHIFFHECQEYCLDVVSSFLLLEEDVLRHMREHGEAPEFRQAVGRVIDEGQRAQQRMDAGASQGAA
jgi:hypothetical protein